jgi:hypothetical protein
MTDWGPAQWDLTDNLRINGIYRFPSLVKSDSWVGKIVNGWSTSDIFSFRTGFPFTPSLSTNRSGTGINGFASGIDRPDLVPGRTISSITNGVSTQSGVDPCPTAGQKLGTPNLWYDPCAFELGPVGELGTFPRDALRGPHQSELDFSLVKDTALRFLGESGSLQFRADMFNVFNHPNLGMPSLAVLSGKVADTVETAPATAGTISTTGVSTSRQIQFGLKLMF